LNSETEIKEAVNKLTQDGTFQLKQVVCDNKNFGNAMVVLSRSTLEVKFIHDRGDTWCELLVPGQPPEWFFFEDVMNALGISERNYGVDFSGTMNVILSLIKKYLKEIEDAFRPENIQRTRQKVRKIVKQRIQRTYGDIQMD
jgi:hypothetical protein